MSRHCPGHPDNSLPLPPFFVVDPEYGVRVPILRPDNTLPDIPPGFPVRPSHPIRWVPAWPGLTPDNTLPGMGPDNSLPTDPGTPTQPIPPGVDNGLPGIDWPVDPGYGVGDGSNPDNSLPLPPGHVDNSLPRPTPAFTAAEKAQIRALAQAKFVNTQLSPMRCLVQAARWVWIMRNPRKPASGNRPDQGLPPQQPGRPDNTLPGQPGQPDQGLPPTQPGQPDNSLPGQPAYPDQGLPPSGSQLPGQPPAYPDQGLPPGQGGYPDQGLPGQGNPGDNTKPSPTPEPQRRR